MAKELTEEDGIARMLRIHRREQMPLWHSPWGLLSQLFVGRNIDLSPFLVNEILSQSKTRKFGDKSI